MKKCTRKIVLLLAIYRAIDSTTTENYRKTSITGLNVLPHNAIKSFRFIDTLNGRLRRIILFHVVNTIIAQCIFDKTSNFYDYFQFIIFKFALVFREVVLIGGESVRDQIRQLQDGVWEIGS